MELHTWLAFVGASAILLVFPGPTVMLVSGFGLAYGARRAWWAAIGVVMGDALSLGCSLAGLGVFLQASATAFTALKLAGAAYMLWLGYRMWRQRPEESPLVASSGGTVGIGIRTRMVGQAFAVTALNPKSILFFVAFVPQFISAQAPPLPQLATMLATFLFLAFLNTLAYICLAGRLRRVASNPRMQRACARTGGAVMVGAGVWTALREG
ncbi:LysE family translocator [Fundidesulfovibrio agrisoli]|uniref:LysE family translocator n=1 Tax=Fundidesulfovibrio agrisoli TaxID=2922717 RepID=UPI001FACE990|nr:LysE family translocator [Fundidesulfovibrio agrisoli]